VVGLAAAAISAWGMWWAVHAGSWPLEILGRSPGRPSLTQPRRLPAQCTPPSAPFAPVGARADPPNPLASLCRRSRIRGPRGPPDRQRVHRPLWIVVLHRLAQLSDGRRQRWRGGRRDGALHPLRGHGSTAAPLRVLPRSTRHHRDRPVVRPPVQGEPPDAAERRRAQRGAHPAVSSPIPYHASYPLNGEHAWPAGCTWQRPLPFDDVGRKGGRRGGGKQASRRRRPP